MTHTPGSWKVMCGDVVLMRDEREVVAWVGNIDGQMIDNARLIAAAPDMLKALEWYGWKVDEGRKNTLEGDRARYDLDRDGGSRAYAAIRKVRGEE